jgi:hypothetical protein
MNTQPPKVEDYCADDENVSKRFSVRKARDLLNKTQEYDITSMERRRASQ